jgi:hypothetical protein
MLAHVSEDNLLLRVITFLGRRGVNGLIYTWSYGIRNIAATILRIIYVDLGGVCDFLGSQLCSDGTLGAPTHT